MPNTPKLPPKPDHVNYPFLHKVEDLTAGQGDGRISSADATKLAEQVTKDGIYTTAEENAVNYAQAAYRWTGAAKRTFAAKVEDANTLRPWEAREAILGDARVKKIDKLAIPFVIEGPDGPQSATLTGNLRRDPALPDSIITTTRVKIEGERKKLYITDAAVDRLLSTAGLEEDTDSSSPVWAYLDAESNDGRELVDYQDGRFVRIGAEPRKIDPKMGARSRRHGPTHYFHPDTIGIQETR